MVILFNLKFLRVRFFNKGIEFCLNLIIRDKLINYTFNILKFQDNKNLR